MRAGLVLLAVASAVLAVDIPAACKTACDASTALINACQPLRVDCTCTEAYERGLYDCGVCTGAGNATDYAHQQTQLDNFVAACGAQNVTLPRLTYPSSTTTDSPPTQTPGSAMGPVRAAVLPLIVATIVFVASY